MKRAHFEHPNTGKITTIAPTPADGKTLLEHGWRYVILDESGTVIQERNPDEARLAIWKAFGH